VQSAQSGQAINLLDNILLQVEGNNLNVGLEASNLADTIAFPVEALEVGEQVHVLDPIEALVVEVKLLVQLEGTVVRFPFLFEKVQNPLLGAAADVGLLHIVVGGVSTPGTGVVFGVSERRVGAAFRLLESGISA